MKQLAIAYQEPCTEPSITHIQTHKATGYKLSPIGKQRISALILVCISIVIPVLTADATMSIMLLPLALGLLFSKQLHMTFNIKNNKKKVGNKLWKILNLIKLKIK